MARLYLWWFSWAVSSLAQVQSFHPAGHDEITYSINVPQQTAQSGSGPIYFQLNSTRPVQWFALGQGTGMPGANIFIVYQSGNNVTVSPRLGEAEVEPLYNKNAQVSLLSDSGVHGGAITANIRCDSCIQWDGGREDVTRSSSPWIWAVKYGSSLDSSDVSASLTQHDDSGVVSINLQQATGGSVDNPFSQSSTTVTTVSSGNSEFSLDRKRIAHAVLMIIAFVVMFPFFALTLHIFPSSRTVRVHGSLQLFTLGVVISGLGLGASLAKDLNLMDNHHPIIGIVVVVSLVLFQPLMGLLQHRFFRQTGNKGIFAYLHRWLGRVMIILGVVNAGLGLRLAEGPRGAVIVYSIAAAVIGLLYCVAVFWVQTGRKRLRVP